MNILILSPFLPYPLDQGGKIRIFNLIKSLAKSHEITLAALVQDSTSADAGPLKELCEEVVLVHHPSRPWSDQISFFTGNSPYNVIRYRSSLMERTILDLIGRKRFDLVQVEFSLMWQYAKLFREIPITLDAHNIEFKTVREIGAGKRSILMRTMYRIEEKRLRRVEERAFRESALCFAVSGQEREELVGYADRPDKVVTAANGVDPDRFTFVPRTRSGKKILFLGGMDYLPNLNAATHFLDEIFPKVRKREADAKVLLVGRELGKLGRLLQMPGVEPHESVPEVLPWFYEADLLAVPLRQGAGTRIKVLEAMASGLPVVSTPKGCEGIDVKNGMELLIADTPQSFIDDIVHIMREPALATSLAENARRLVIARYTWQAAADIMNESYRALIELNG